MGTDEDDGMGTKVYEGAGSWYVHKDPEGGRPSQRMVQRKGGAKV